MTARNSIPALSSSDTSFTLFSLEKYLQEPDALEEPDLPGSEVRKEQRMDMDSCSFVNIEFHTPEGVETYLAVVRDVSAFGLGVYFVGTGFPAVGAEVLIYGTFRYRLRWRKELSGGCMRLGFELENADRSIFAALETEN